MSFEILTIFLEAHTHTHTLSPYVVCLNCTAHSPLSPLSFSSRTSHYESDSTRIEAADELQNYLKLIKLPNFPKLMLNSLFYWERRGLQFCESSFDVDV